MLQQLSFLEDLLADGTATVWPALDEHQRAKAVAKLALLIAKVATSVTSSGKVPTDE